MLIDDLQLLQKLMNEAAKLRGDLDKLRTGEGKAVTKESVCRGLVRSMIADLRAAAAAASSVAAM